MQQTHPAANYQMNGDPNRSAVDSVALDGTGITRVDRTGARDLMARPGQRWHKKMTHIKTHGQYSPWKTGGAT
eukprot:1954964-Amphidinium_carterae.1